MHSINQVEQKNSYANRDMFNNLCSMWNFFKYAINSFAENTSLEFGFD